MISGTLGREPIAEGRLRGEEISFTAGGTAYAGRVDRNRMRLHATVDGQVVEWTAAWVPGLGR
jgi:hypothetical protein